MHIPKYWAKGSVEGPTGKGHPIVCWGWSDESPQAAEALGRQRAAAVAEMLRSGERPDHYHYGDRPVREAILDYWGGRPDAPEAAVSLNTYGCEVLNTARVMFVDIDLPEPGAGERLIHGLKKLFGKAGQDPKEQRIADALARIEGWVEAEPNCGVRVYRTLGGLRCLLTSREADPLAPDTECIMEALQADPLYMRLCSTQKCFRARLTPKPWRCNALALRIQYPWPDASVEDAVEQWRQSYAVKCADFATCRFLEHYGNPRMSPEMERIVHFHDDKTRAHSKMKLA